MQNSGISFQVKVEANEGIWVEEPGKIDTCPNCKFMFEQSTMYATWNHENQPATIITNGYSNNYNDIIAQSGKDYFLGVITNNSNQLTNAYTCALKGTTPFCIEGNTNDLEELYIRAKNIEEYKQKITGF